MATKGDAQADEPTRIPRRFLLVFGLISGVWMLFLPILGLALVGAGIEAAHEHRARQGKAIVVAASITNRRTLPRRGRGGPRHLIDLEWRDAQGDRVRLPDFELGLLANELVDCAKRSPPKCAPTVQVKYVPGDLGSAYLPAYQSKSAAGPFLLIALGIVLIFSWLTFGVTAWNRRASILGAFKPRGS